MIPDVKRNAVNINSILIYSISEEELISKSFFVSPLGLESVEGNVIIEQNVSDESVNTIKTSNV